MSQLNPAELEAAIRALLSANQKIAAVKLYREQTGVGLAEAKDAVEVCERGGTLPSPGVPATASQGPPVASGSRDALVLEHLLAGRKIDAVKAYRQATGAGLKEAKDAVEELARRHGIEVSGGCLGVLLVSGVVTAALGLAAAWALT